MKNVVHVTASGLFATWYFLSGVGMPANPTQKAFKRATTSSFGSICLGSLLVCTTKAQHTGLRQNSNFIQVAILKTLRQLLNASRGRSDNWLKCILACILAMLDNLINYFSIILRIRAPTTRTTRQFVLRVCIVFRRVMCVIT